MYLNLYVKNVRGKFHNRSIESLIYESKPDLARLLFRLKLYTRDMDRHRLIEEIYLTRVSKRATLMQAVLKRSSSSVAADIL